MFPFPSYFVPVDALARLPRVDPRAQPATCPLAVELRNRDWLDTEQRDATMEFFEEHRLSYVCVDVPPGFPARCRR